MVPERLELIVGGPDLADLQLSVQFRSTHGIRGRRAANARLRRGVASPRRTGHLSATLAKSEPMCSSWTSVRWKCSRRAYPSPRRLGRADRARVSRPESCVNVSAYRRSSATARRREDVAWVNKSPDIRSDAQIRDGPAWGRGVGRLGIGADCVGKDVSVRLYARDHRG
jgi:hypothetical protein